MDLIFLPSDPGHLDAIVSMFMADLAGILRDGARSPVAWREQHDGRSLGQLQQDEARPLVGVERVDSNDPNFVEAVNWLGWTPKAVIKTTVLAEGSASLGALEALVGAWLATKLGGARKADGKWDPNSHREGSLRPRRFAWTKIPIGAAIAIALGVAGLTVAALTTDGWVQDLLNDVRNILIGVLTGALITAWIDWKHRDRQWTLASALLKRRACAQIWRIQASIFGDYVAADGPTPAGFELWKLTRSISEDVPSMRDLVELSMIAESVADSARKYRQIPERLVTGVLDSDDAVWVQRLPRPRCRSVHRSVARETQVLNELLGQLEAVSEDERLVILRIDLQVNLSSLDASLEDVPQAAEPGEARITSAIKSIEREVKDITRRLRYPDQAAKEDDEQFAALRERAKSWADPHAAPATAAAPTEPADVLPEKAQTVPEGVVGRLATAWGDDPFEWVPFSNEVVSFTESLSHTLRALLDIYTWLFWQRVEMSSWEHIERIQAKVSSAAR